MRAHKHVWTQTHDSAPTRVCACGVEQMRRSNGGWPEPVGEQLSKRTTIKARRGPQRGITRNYEHVMLEFPDWKPSYPGEKAPYPHLVPSLRKGYYKGACSSRREVEEFSARTGKKWGSP